MKYEESDYRELLRQFEGMVRALNTKFSEDDIFKLVSLILNNHLQDGKFTPEYVELSKSALNMRKSNGEILNPTQIAIASGFRPRVKKI